MPYKIEDGICQGFSLFPLPQGPLFCSIIFPSHLAPSDMLSYLFIICPPQLTCELHVGRVSLLFTVYQPALKIVVAHSRRSVNSSSVNKWINEWVSILPRGHLKFSEMKWLIHSYPAIMRQNWGLAGAHLSWDHAASHRSLMPGHRSPQASRYAHTTWPLLLLALGGNWEVARTTGGKEEE
jgi:hypothetical protein